MIVRRRTRIFPLLLLLLGLATGAAAQDGRVVQRDTVRISASLEAYLARTAPAGQAPERLVLQRITYLSGGLRVRGYVAEPAGGTRLPAVIYNRGGNREFGALNDSTAALLLGPLALRGYVVVASQYRGNAGGEGREEFGGSDVDDVLSLLPLLDAEPRVDATRIGMFGWSRGGMMTYLALARTRRIRAAVVGSGLADAFETVRRRPEMERAVFAELVPGWPRSRQQALRARSAVQWADRLHKETPILLLHGSADWRVHPTEALRMAQALYDARHPFRFVFFEGGDHGLAEHRPEVLRLVGEWMDRYVRDAGPLPNLEPHGS